MRCSSKIFVGSIHLFQDGGIRIYVLTINSNFCSLEKRYKITIGKISIVPIGVIFSSLYQNEYLNNLFFLFGRRRE
jgi:hypothetical protein